MLPRLLLLSAGLLTLTTPILAQLPYNPTRIIPAKGGSYAYLFSPQPSSFQFSLHLLDTSEELNKTSPRTKLSDTLPFLSGSTSKAFITLADHEGITVLAGDCKEATNGLELWRLTTGNDGKNSTWSTLPVTASDGSLGSRYLAAGFTFSPTASVPDTSLYVFGGMCPDRDSSDASNWVSGATYSNTMLTLTPDSPSDASSPYQLSLTGSRAPPIAEAGLTITPLAPTFSNTSDNNVSQQQNFVLLGGHTQSAFINMSQLAIFALPQASWAFVGVSQSRGTGGGKIKSRDAITVEPRSGHTAILTEDGSKVVVLGGWVGDINTPAQPQLAILEVAQEYGGRGDWTWTVPTSTSNPFTSGAGIYGHGVALLPGGVMMVTGGYPISSSGSKHKRKLSDQIFFLNTTTLDWTSTYANPYPSGSSSDSASAESSSSGLKTSEKAGLGAGLGLGLATAAGVAIVWIWYSRKLRARRAVREKGLRELALGAERYHSPAPLDEDDPRYSGMRTASWGAAQERQIESSGHPDPWAPMAPPDQNGRSRMNPDGGDSNNSRYAGGTEVLMEIPSPTRGLRKSLNSRLPMGYGPFNQHPPTGPGAVFRIDEEDEGSQTGSLKRSKTPKIAGDRSSVTSDPFKDPSPAADGSRHEDVAAQRKKEVEGWVEDWQSAAESMSLSRSTSQAHSRTYSNLSQFRSQDVVVGGSGRGSPEKSDRTGSNLSESSVMSTSSFQRSLTGTLSRNISQRSASAGHALISSAAAAMGRFGYTRQGPVDRETNPGLARAPSNRSLSLNADSARPSSSRDRTETFSSARSDWGPSTPGEDQALLNRNRQRQQFAERDYRTLPESPGKEKYARTGSLTGSGRRALNLFESAKRVFTGTGGVDVQDRVAAFESHSGQSSPTKRAGQPEMAEAAPNRTLSAGASFWRGKRGAKDWDTDLSGPSDVGSASTVRRKPVPGLILNDNTGALDDDEEDWDVETAVQRRVVQVMFTVPKEKLRVVNADALSLLSSNRSDVDHEEDKERDQIKRMSSVREGDEDNDPDDETTKGKGKEREY
ncbi:uncharacterized protein Z518_05957 [Rhinocladiella mackenziei CBS 650.93]|uniref:Rhinocladiella mackenziei CBS 650.93 unplaced genomic scaffold supercont1.4, whole genome shotgun sequence n=1 Tax=Rhinocladiella mackenziei CBS 650.93 TaxID=1442369 RepID=A0A0D2J7S3_9EURO|nr:uncharacterized protein Z518_05957 [Rhinocladiella mackenziei CBS 650.93]KIX05085.1 hypothetical protein Z518_05957 [Rhinocladiella mackenziei CBS 650.93]